MWPARGLGGCKASSGCAGGGQREDKDYFKPVLITAPNRDWGWELQLSWGKLGRGVGESPAGRGLKNLAPILGEWGAEPSPAVSWREVMRKEKA